MDERIRVLHVDDDPEICDLTASYLERIDDRFIVVTETSARGGLDVLDSEQIDCVVSDYQMPEINGFGFLEMVKERDPDLPFILYTGKGSEEIASEAITAGVTDYLQKKGGGSQYELLANRITNAVDQYRPTHGSSSIENPYEGFLAGMLGMYAITGGEGADSVIAECNDGFAERLGYDTDELVGTPLTALLAADSQSILQPDGESVINEWPARTFETSSGDPVELRVRSSPWNGDSSQDRTLFGFIDDSQRAELAEQAEFYETILNTVPDAVYALDEEMHYLFVNQGMAELTGYPQEEIIGSHKSMVNTDESVKSGQAKRMDLAEHHRDGVKIAIHPHVTADGEEIPTEVRFSLLPTEDDEFRGTAGVVRDVTDRLERQRELERQNRRLDEFASVVSHDLRNPINIAQGRVDLLLSDCDDDDIEPHLTKASEALERMNTLIDDVLSFARQGEAVTEFEPADLRTLAQDAWEAVGDQQGTVVVANDATIAGKPVRLQRLFENLLRNAREHVPAPVTIRVGTLTDGFYIEDDGPGIPPDERDDVFDPGVTTAEGGTGFGLAIVKSIVESHGWTIEVTEAETGGARFEISGLDRL